MSLVPLIIDRRLGGAVGVSTPCSVLDLPLGLGRVLDRTVGELAGLLVSRIWILSSGGVRYACPPLARRQDGPRIEVLDQRSLTAALGALETSDYLLVLEAGSWPTDGLDLEAVSRAAEEYHGATHWVAMGATPEQATERIECDEAGQVKRVLRLYDAKNWHELAGEAIACSVVPARSVVDLRFDSLGELRRELASRGVLSRDVPAASDLLDLVEEPAYLALSERVVIETTREGAAPQGYQWRGAGVLVGSGSRIHPSVRLVPPVIVQPEATIEAQVTVVGPSLIGAGSEVKKGAIIAQSVVGEGSAVSEGVQVRHRRCSGWCDVSSAVGFEEESEGGGMDEHTPPPLSHMGGDLSRPEAAVPSFSRQVNLALKRAMDIVISALSLIVLSPLLLVVGLLVKLDSPGPVFFCHRRESKGGKEFPCIKFRTMRVDAHSKQRELYGASLVDGPQFKLQDDPRATRVGRWLRATNIDELPQLLNVLVGHMSLVGPRPSPFRENQICVPWRRARLSVRPGITGLWQVCREDDRSRGGFHEWIYYDILYVRHFSAWLDIKIVLATFATLAGRWRVPLRWLVRRAERRLVGSWPMEVGPQAQQSESRAEGAVSGAG